LNDPGVSVVHLAPRFRVASWLAWDHSSSVAASECARRSTRRCFVALATSATASNAPRLRAASCDVSRVAHRRTRILRDQPFSRSSSQSPSRRATQQRCRGCRARTTSPHCPPRLVTRRRPRECGRATARVAVRPPVPRLRDR